MKAWVLHDIGNITMDDEEIPKPGTGQVLVRVKAAGVCGSDIPRIYSTGAHKMPIIPGHEFSGEVVEVGVDVCDTWIGKRVGVFPLIPCRNCELCNKLRYEMCRNYNYLGSRCDGGFAEYVVVPEWNLIEVGENVLYEEAAMLEPMAVAVHAIKKVKPVAEDKVLVIGLGTIGELIVMFLAEMGIKSIFVAGNKKHQYHNMIKLGIPEKNYCDVNTEDVGKWVADRTGGQGATVVFECVGTNETITQAVDCAAPEARICMVGNPRRDIAFGRDTYWKILRNQLTVNGTWNSSYYGSDAEDIENDDWHYAVNKLIQKKINPSIFITHILSMDDLEKGLTIMRDKTEEFVKVMITL